MLEIFGEIASMTRPQCARLNQNPVRLNKIKLQRLTAPKWYPIFFT